jgi:hypothetical protein
LASGNQTVPFGSYAIVPAAGPLATARKVTDEWTMGGWVLFVMALSLAGSAYGQARLDLFGLSLHPSMILVMLVAPWVMLTRLHEFPTKPLLGMMVFLAMYIFANLGTPRFSTEALKVGAIVFTIISTALLVRSPADFRLGVLAISIACIVISVKSLESDSLDGDHGALETSNKNALSLYLAPALLLAGYTALDRRTATPWLKIALFLAALFMVAATFTSGNRSGWVAALLIGLMLLVSSGRWLMACILVTVLGLATYFYMTHFGATQGFDWAWEKTVSGNKSDSLRVELFLAAMQVAFENPVLGVSAHRLPYELARTTYATESHNVVAHLAAASGFICLGALLMAGWFLWRWKPDFALTPEAQRQFKNARRLLRMMLFLWLARGMFSHEILYSPGFGMGIGLALGLVLVATRGGEQRRGAAPITLPLGASMAR